MKSKSKVALESKLTVYLACYHEAKKSKDLERMVLIAPIISDLRNEIALLEE